MFPNRDTPAAPLLITLMWGVTSYKTQDVETPK